MKLERFSSRGPALVLAACALTLAGLLALAAPARADVEVHVDISNAPPPPAIVFHARPHRVYDRGTRVYVIDDPHVGDHDCFRYGGYYWLFSGGYWYRTRSWNARFVVVQPRYVPGALYRVPERHWKHHPAGPPGLAKKGGLPPGQAKKQGEGPPPGHGKGH